MSDKIFKPLADVFALIHAGGEPYQWTQDAILAAEWLRDNPNYSVKEFVSLDRYQAAVTDDLSALQQKLEAVLAENVALRKAHPQPFGPEMMKAIDAYIAKEDEVPEQGMMEAFFILRDSITLRSAQVDATLNEVRADGVEAFANGGCAYEIPHRIKSLLLNFAAQLRAGSTEGGV